MGHITEHCDTPTKVKKWQEGMLWACECGQVWRYGISELSMKAYFHWHKVFVLEKAGE